VARLELSVEQGRVDVGVEHPRRVRFACPENGCDHGGLPVYDHAEGREWRHLDSMQFRTFLHARPPRVRCPEHGVRQVRLPWAEPMSRFTALFERLAIDVLAQGDVDGSARLLRLSWDQAWHLAFQRFRGLDDRLEPAVGWPRSTRPANAFRPSRAAGRTTAGAGFP